ncbi:transcriptional regulator, TetR family [Bradyrhizobium shewense]|uniref:Transcriptional regulator, TetR family n=1 Tax=Bradyrhizobium shewense TaxID=1761772 RepID=A0A1C3TZY7_9BRAD|nr:MULTISPECIES: TetR/AcrR family transcriptional regulator [Bradyrhizobium]PPQ21354.1 TetR/AcrR family transcriptional regulator [Bradyrhizobium sp. AC87j1]SCB08813.1 transcriptional regulator, TetR family [Bradyrhizobium shewense]
MRYPKDHGQHTRRRIVESASRGLRQAGADGLSVADLMKLANLTHGSFYAYFKSRDALVVEGLALAMDRTIVHWLSLTQGLPAGKGFDALVESYLGPRHRDDPGRGCALPALAADIGRSGPEARRTLERGLGKMIDIIARLIAARPSSDVRQTAAGAIATMVGSIVLARAVDDKPLSDLLLEAGRQALGSPVASDCERTHSADN